MKYEVCGLIKTQKLIYILFFVQGSRCGWNDWYDPPMCQRAVQIIPGLLRARNRHEDAIEELKGQLRKTKMYLMLSWLAFVSIMVMYILA